MTTGKLTSLESFRCFESQFFKGDTALAVVTTKPSRGYIQNPLCHLCCITNNLGRILTIMLGFLKNMDGLVCFPPRYLCSRAKVT